MGVDDRITEELERLAEPGSVEPDLVERLARRKRRHRLARRAEAVTLVVAVLAGTAGGGWALYKAFRPSRAVSPATTSGHNGLITFVRSVPGIPGKPSAIFAITPEGEDMGQMVPLPEGKFLSAPTWSPDGTRLALVQSAHPSGQASKDSGDSAIATVRADGSFLTPLLEEVGVIDGDPSWSPDGSQIAFSSNRDPTSVSEIFVVDSDGSGLRQVTDLPNNGVDHAARPSWSPDGNAIAFSRSRYEDATKTETQKIWAINPGGGDLRQITTGPGIDEEPAWSPDGSMIAFVRTEGGNFHVMLANADGSGARVVAEDAFSPAWAPDGSALLVAGFSQPGIFLVKPDGSGIREVVSGEAGDPAWQPVATAPAPAPSPRTTPTGDPGVNGTAPGFDYAYAVTTDGGDFDIGMGTLSGGVFGLDQVPGSDEGAPAWSPDGTRLAYSTGNSSDTDIWVLPTLSSDGRLLAGGPEADESNPDWSPDGNRIVFDSIGPNGTQIELVNADGSGRRALTSGAASSFDPDWSPDGRTILFARDELNATEDSDLWLMNADGTNARRFTVWDGSEYMPAWSPDGRKIAFIGTSEGLATLFVMRADGSDASLLTDLAGPSNPTWSNDGRWIVFSAGTFEEGKEAAELYAIRPDGTDLTQLTDTPELEVAPAFNPAARPRNP